MRQLLHRLAGLAEDLPEIAELDLDPLYAGADCRVAVGARVRVGPGPAQAGGR